MSGLQAHKMQKKHNEFASNCEECRRSKEQSVEWEAYRKNNPHDEFIKVVISDAISKTYLNSQVDVLF